MFLLVRRVFLADFRHLLNISLRGVTRTTTRRDIGTKQIATPRSKDDYARGAALSGGGTARFKPQDAHPDLTHERRLP